MANNKALSPDSVEFIPVTDLSVGDVLVSFSRIGMDRDIPPTRSDLMAKRTSYTLITDISINESIMDINGGIIFFATINPIAGNAVFAWRIKR
jgi:hypothetical protein